MRCTTRLSVSFLFWLIGFNFVSWPSGADPSAGAPTPSKWGEFSAVLQLTTKADELFAAWERPGAKVPLVSTDVVTRKAPVAAVVFFTGCTPNNKRVCDADVEFQLLKPDGSSYLPVQKTKLWTHKPPRHGALQLGEGYIEFEIGEASPSGLYTCRAHLIDKVSRDEAELNATFHVDPSPAIDRSP